MQRVVGLGAVVLAAALGIWLVLREADDPRPTDPHSAEQVETAKKAAPQLQGRGIEAPPNTPTKTTPPPALPSKPAPRALLRGELVGLDADEATPARVSVAAIGKTAHVRPETEVTGEAGTDGRFELDVSALFDAGLPLFEFAVRVEHPRYMPASARVLLGKYYVTGDPRAPSVWTVRVPLSRAGVLVGAVQDAAGGRLAGATAAVYRMEEDGPRMQAADSMRTGSDGAFRLRIGGAGRYLVVAALEGLRPDSVEVLMRDGQEMQLDPFVLRAGVRVEGVVTVNGKPAQRVGVELRASGSRRVYMTNVRVLWQDGVLFAGGLETLTNKEGSFRFEGLDARTYRLSVVRVPSMNLHPDLEESLEQDIQAPAATVRVDIEAAHFVVTVRSDGEPLEGAMVSIGGGSGSYGTATNDEGQRAFDVPWDTELTLRVEADDHEPFEETFHSKRDRWEPARTVDLKRMGARPTLLVRIKGPDGAPVADTGIGLYRVGKDKRHPWRRDDFEGSKDGTFRVTQLEPGPLRVVVRPGGGWWWGTSNFIQSEQVVHVPEQGEATVAFSAVRGGRLRIAARGPDGQLMRARCRVLNAEGERLRVAFVLRTKGGTSAGTTRVAKEAPSLVHPALAPGAYRVELSMDGFHPVTRDVTVRAGKTTEVDVKLQRASR